MKARELRAALNKLEMSQLGLARLFGVDARTVRRWILEEFEMPKIYAAVIRLLLSKKITIEDLEGIVK